VPYGSQESSAPAFSAAAVLANAIAILDFQLKFIVGRRDRQQQI
jgi:hypothetical protein